MTNSNSSLPMPPPPSHFSSSSDGNNNSPCCGTTTTPQNPLVSLKKSLKLSLSEMRCWGVGSNNGGTSSSSGNRQRVNHHSGKFLTLMDALGSPQSPAPHHQHPKNALFQPFSDDSLHLLKRGHFLDTGGGGSSTNTTVVSDSEAVTMVSRIGDDIRGSGRNRGDEEASSLDIGLPRTTTTATRNSSLWSRFVTKTTRTRSSLNCFSDGDNDEHHQRHQIITRSPSGSSSSTTTTENRAHFGDAGAAVSTTTMRHHHHRNNNSTSHNSSSSSPSNASTTASAAITCSITDLLSLKKARNCRLDDSSCSSLGGGGGDDLFSAGNGTITNGSTGNATLSQDAPRRKISKSLRSKRSRPQLSISTCHQRLSGTTTTSSGSTPKIHSSQLNEECSQTPQHHHYDYLYNSACELYASERYAEAFHLFRRIAPHHSKAAYNCANMCRDGLGIDSYFEEKQRRKRRASCSSTTPKPKKRKRNISTPRLLLPLLSSGGNDSSHQNTSQSSLETNVDPIPTLTDHEREDRNIKEAIKYYLCAVKLDHHPRAMFNLANLYRERGQERDNEKAIALYKRATLAGHVRSYCKLGNCYVAQRKYQKARKCYQKGIDADHASAWRNMGIMYEKGMGVEENLLTARKYYQQALEREASRAACLLRNCESKILNQTCIGMM